MVDGAGNILANDRTENQTYTAVTVRYALEDGTAMPNTAPSVLPVPTGASVNWQPPQTLNGHAFVKKEVSGSTVTFVYREAAEQPEVKTYTVRYVWGEAPSDRALPTDNRAYRSVEQARDAVDTTFTAASTSNAQNGGLTGTWAFSGWDNGTLEGTTVVFRGTWRFTPDGGSAGGGSTGGGSTGGGGGGSVGGGSAATPTKPETTTKPDGTKVETTTGKDGSVTKTETAPNGSTGTVKTDKNGQAEATAKLSAKALEDAKKNGEAVKAPVEVEAARNSSTAPTVSIELPKGTGETKVEIPVSNANSGTVAVLVHPDGTEEILKSSLPTENGIRLKLDGDATVKIVDNSKPFADTQNHWSKDDVDFVAARELFNGVGGNRFDVSGSMTRGMVNTVLARLAGANTEGGAKWYDKGTEWARTNGISDGTNPTAPVTREQLAAMLYRFAGAPAVSGALSFNDANAVSEYARSALLWATQNGILNGVGGNLAAPAALAERAQVAAMLARYLRSAG